MYFVRACDDRLRVGDQLEQQELLTVKRGGLVGLALDKGEAVASNANHPRYNQVPREHQAHVSIRLSGMLTAGN